MYDGPIIALVGKIGHGKTHLLNKLTGKNFPSSMGAKSCTRQLQYGYTKRHEILALDTPGFGASDDVAQHIAAQKLVLEGTSLSGVFVVIRYARADEMAEIASKIMTFLGSDDIRIIVTFADTVSGEEGYNPKETKSRLSSLLDIPTQNILVVGKKTPAAALENSIKAMLHEPREYEITEEQVASISALCVANRRFTKVIDEVNAKIAAASKECSDLVKSRKSNESDAAIVSIQHATSTMVEETKNKIFRESEGLSDDQCNVIYGKAGFSLALRLKTFIVASNKLLTWDVTDQRDSRNLYKKCNCCGAIFNKTVGCDGATVCGTVPGDIKKPQPKLVVEFRIGTSGWFVQYFWNGAELRTQFVLEALRSFYTGNGVWSTGGALHVRREGSVFESGCGAQIAWSTMLPVEPELIQVLGSVEIQNGGAPEKNSKANFDAQVQLHEAYNFRILRDALQGPSKKFEIGSPKDSVTTRINSGNDILKKTTATHAVSAPIKIRSRARRRIIPKADHDEK